jgi:very-short-patch-repair endonuclease
MTEVYNRLSEKETRRKLRKSLPPAEIILWSKLRQRQICSQKSRRQFSVGPFVVDFYCPALKLAIEIDGRQSFSAG